MHLVMSVLKSQEVTDKHASYSQTCLKGPFINRQNEGLKDRWEFNAGRKYSRMQQGSFLQYF